MKAKILKSEDGQWYCLLIARNGQVLFTSETYKQKKSVLRMLSNNLPKVQIVE
jgi:uncharacterized protein YegP (UPF0339 family)